MLQTVPFSSVFSCNTSALDVFHLSITSLHRSFKGYCCNVRCYKKARKSNCKFWRVREEYVVFYCFTESACAGLTYFRITIMETYYSKSCVIVCISVLNNLA